MQFMDRTKEVAYGNDFLIATRDDTVGTTENYVNVELSIIEGWSRRNMIKFNDKNSKVMLVIRKNGKRIKTSCYNYTPSH
jgi:hypothetical protein